MLGLTFRRTSRGISNHIGTKQLTRNVSKHLLILRESFFPPNFPRSANINSHFHTDTSRPGEEKLDSHSELFKELDIKKIAVIGGGNMADAVVTGVIAKKLMPSQKIVVSDPHLGKYCFIRSNYTI
jgi:hypothetical protein